MPEFFEVQPRQKNSISVKPIDFFTHFEFHRVTENISGYFNLESILDYDLVPLHASVVR